VWREPSSFTEHTLRWFDAIATESSIGDEDLEVLLKLTTEPDHPWNADFLHQNLLRFEMPDRDEWWSVYLATSDYQEEEDQTRRSRLFGP